MKGNNLGVVFVPGRHWALSIAEAILGLVALPVLLLALISAVCIVWRQERGKFAR